PTPAPPPLPSFPTRRSSDPAAAVPAGYKTDSGQAYGARNGLTYGWVGTLPQTFDRNLSLSPDQRYDTFAYLQQSGANLKWEMAEPSRAHHGKVVAGDARRHG